MIYLHITKVRTIQNVIYPQGTGQAVRLAEKKSKELFLKDRSTQPIVREIEGYEFITNPRGFYDQIAIEFERSYPVGMFSNVYTDTETLNIFVAEGLGAGIVSALNSYITSPEIGQAAVTI